MTALMLEDLVNAIVKAKKEDLQIKSDFLVQVSLDCSLAKVCYSPHAVLS